MDTPSRHSPWRDMNPDEWDRASRAVDTPAPPEPLTAREEADLRRQLAAGTYWIGPVRVERLLATLDAARALATPDPSIPERPAEPLPVRIVVGKNGAYWLDYGDHYSMPPVSTDNDPVEVAAVFVRSRITEVEEWVREIRQGGIDWHAAFVQMEVARDAVAAELALCRATPDPFANLPDRDDTVYWNARQPLATPDPSIPERPDAEREAGLDVERLHRAMKEVGRYNSNHRIYAGPQTAAKVAAEYDRLRSAAPTGASPSGSIPERPAEPLRAALAEVLAIVEETSGSLASLDRAAIERIVRAALAQQSIRESRDE